MPQKTQFTDAHTGLNLLAMAPQSCEEKLKAYLLELFPEPIVFRHKVTKQSKGLISSRTLANYDCAKSKDYPLTKLTYNGKACYDRDQFVEFLLSRLARKVGIREKAHIAQLLEGFGLDGKTPSRTFKMQGENLCTV